MVVLLTDGDITKREEVLWSYTLEEVQPYVKFQSRKVLFREAVIRFLVGETPAEKAEKQREIYRRLAQKAGKELPEDFELRELN